VRSDGPEHGIDRVGARRRWWRRDVGEVAAAAADGGEAWEGLQEELRRGNPWWVAPLLRPP
jgi:hypothetical protein